MLQEFFNQFVSVINLKTLMYYSSIMYCLFSFLCVWWPSLTYSLNFMHGTLSFAGNHFMVVLTNLEGTGVLLTLSFMHLLLLCIYHSLFSISISMNC